MSKGRQNKRGLDSATISQPSFQPHFALATFAGGKKARGAFGLGVASSLIALLSATTALAQSSDANEIVVTGTSIRGQAPVGAALLSVDRTAIDSTAAATIQQILKTVPALSNMGQSSQNNTAPAIHNLGASSSYSTLVLIDGHRFSLGGQTQTLPDPGILPPSAVERVEVLADGASSVYGSDAVAGVINFVTRKNFDGLNASAQAGFGDHYKTQSVNAIWGKNYDDGNMMITMAYSQRDPLFQRYRPFTYPDQRAKGGTNFLNNNCEPATINLAGAGGGNFAGTAATAPFTQAACSNFNYSSLAGEEKRYNAMAKLEHRFGDNLTINVDGVFSDRRQRSDSSRGSVSSVAAFQSGPRANPFYRNPVGYTGTATQQAISWSADELLGPGAYSLNNSLNYYIDGTFDYSLTENWRLTGLALYGHEESLSASYGSLCSSCVNLALNGTTNSSGNLTAPSIPGTPTIIQNLPLTAANALDLWNPAATNRTSQAVKDKLIDNYTFAPNYYGIAQYRLGTDGTLLTLPGGAVRVAAGVEYVNYTLDINRTQPNNTGPASTGSSYLFIPLERNVKSAFGEAFVPIVGPDMNIPLVRALNVNASVRWDEYSDIGETTNPRVGGEWEIIQGFKIRGNWASSFVAPQLSSVGDRSRGGFNNFTCYGSSCPAGGINVNSGNINVSTASFPSVVGVPLSSGGGALCTAAMATCSIAATSGTLFNSGPADPRPSKSESWSVGFDTTPALIPGLRATVTLFNVQYKDFITGTSMINALNTPALNLIHFFPNGATQADLDRILPGGAILQGSLPPTIYYLVSGRQGNFNNVNTQGIDASIDYRFETDSAGAFSAGAAITELLKFDQKLSGGQEFYSILGTTGANSTFGAVKTQARFNVGWELGGFGLDVFDSYISSYKNWSATTVTPLITRADSAPIGGGDTVKAQHIIDLNLRYTFENGVFGDAMAGTSVFLNIDNVFDKDPAFYNGSSGFDGFTGNVTGRVTTVGLRAKF